jgi:hypothetical protein
MYFEVIVESTVDLRGLLNYPFKAGLANPPEEGPVEVGGSVETPLAFLFCICRPWLSFPIQSTTSLNSPHLL